MSDKLKDFIDFHRTDFDLYEPGEHVWAGISAGIVAPAGWFGSKLLKGFLKFGFGASVVVATGLGAYSLLKSPEPVEPGIKAKAEVVTKTPMIVDSPVVKTNSPQATIISSSDNQNRMFDKSEETYTIKPDTIPTVSSEKAAEEEDSQEINNAGDSSLPGKGINLSVNKPCIEKSVVSNGLVLEKNITEVECARKNSGDSLVVDTLFEGIKKLVIKSEFCDINLQGRKNEKLKIHGTLGEFKTVKGKRNKRTVERTFMSVTYQRDGSVLTVKVSPPREDNIMFGGYCTTTMESSELFFEVPETIDVSVNNTDGSVKATGLSGKEFGINTGCGKISCENIFTAVKLNSSSGSIKLDNVSGDVDAHSSYGNIKASRIKGAVKLITSSGSIKASGLNGNGVLNSSYGNIKLDSAMGNFEIRASSGNVSLDKLTGNISVNSTYGTLRLSNIAGDIEARCSSGSVFLTNTAGKLNILTSYGNVKGENVRLTQSSDFTLSSGWLKLNLLNKLNELSFDLQSSSGNITVEKEEIKSRSSDRLTFGQGAIKIKATSTYGSQVFN